MKVNELIKQLLFPLRCPVCDEPVRPFGHKICPECLEKRKLLHAPYCMKCGKKLYDDNELCRDCSRNAHTFIRGRALYEYESVVSSVYRFKYSGRQEYADFFGEEMAMYLGEFIQNIQPDALIPVPLHRKRQNKRGYNQAALLADALGWYTGVPVRHDVLFRTKNTTPLKYLNPKERQNNLKKAFNIGQNDVKLKKVILVDDIYTTGSTMNEAASVLIKAGVKQVYFVALACGEGV